MQPLESIDIRFKVNTSIDKEDICFYSVLQKPNPICTKQFARRTRKSRLL